MSAYLRLRAVPPPALRNSATWLERLFDDGAETVRRCLDQERIYAGAPAHEPGDRPRIEAVLGGRPVFRAGRPGPPLLVLTAAQARRVAGFLATADFDALWLSARDQLLPHYGGETAEPETWGAFAAAHQELRAFYAQTAEYGDAVVKWLSEA
ncbi:hypothetical protein AV521_00205 [Streptomyces sp. IMTB 2501]|uniref:DUF1877 family protein n=1 Tax=Streptomyces sp. IMTB 2501 TaxID=1776340 RepID=UPI00097002FA|nr:DUF1877 family protein [Streptomyces sp. IMTB 2501]OLZ74162.1 hypothetical protein AV521_00205 [Streptomyces sp. IMTB 2501]